MISEISSFMPAETAIYLSQSHPFLKQYKGKIFVIKYGGNAMTDDSLQQQFARDVVTLKLLGIYPIVVHGGGPQINQALEKIGKKGVFIQGMRVTDHETMKIVEHVLTREVQKNIVNLINQNGGKAIGLSGKENKLIRARKLKLPNPEKQGHFIDLGQVGEVDKIDSTLIKKYQADGFIPVISTIGFDENGMSYNINADLVASKIAIELAAEKLLMLTNMPGVLDKTGNVLSQLNTRDIDNLIVDGTLSGGMLPKIASAIEAAKAGASSVHIIDGREPQALIHQVISKENSLGTTIIDLPI